MQSIEAMRTSVMAADMARESIVKEQAKVRRLQQDLVNHVGKKPKLA